MSETPAIRPNITEPRIVTDGIYLFRSISTGLLDLIRLQRRGWIAEYLRIPGPGQHPGKPPEEISAGYVK